MRGFVIPEADAFQIAEGNMDGRASASGRPVRAWSQTLACADAPCAGTGRPHTRPPAPCRSGPHRGRRGAEADDARGWGVGHSVIVAVKPTNAGERSAAEPVEPRAEAEGNAGQQSTHRTPSRASVTQALERIRRTARGKEEEGEVHRAPPPHQHRPARSGVLCTQRARRRGCRTGLRGETTSNTSSVILRTCTLGSTGERISHCRRGVYTSPSRTGGSAHSRSQPWRTRSSNGLRSRC